VDNSLKDYYQAMVMLLMQSDDPESSGALKYYFNRFIQLKIEMEGDVA